MIYILSIRYASFLLDHGTKSKFMIEVFLTYCNCRTQLFKYLSYFQPSGFWHPLVCPKQYVSKSAKLCATKHSSMSQFASLLTSSDRQTRLKTSPPILTCNFAIAVSKKLCVHMTLVVEYRYWIYKIKIRQSSIQYAVSLSHWAK